MKKYSKLMLCLVLMSGSWGCSLENQCTEGQMRCVSDEKSSIGSLQFCYSGLWGDTNVCANNNSCNADKSNCGECTDGIQNCIDGKIFTCVSGAWDKGVDCPFNTCMTPTECGVCNDEMRSCSDGQYKLCHKGSWIEQETSRCESGKCADEYHCADLIECSDNEKKCMDKTLQTCTEKGLWSDGTLCPDDGKCKQDNSDCAECKASESKCENNKLYTCSNETWIVSRECTCKDSSSCMECEPGEEQCIKSDSYQVCTKDGQWGSTESCGEQEICAPNGTKVSCQKGCVNNTFMCMNDKLYQCQNENWTLSDNCQNGCDKSTLKCYECQTGDISCKDGKSKTCINHVWEKETACKADACINEFACANCVKDSVSCTNNNKIGVITNCPTGETLTEERCNGVSCNSNRNGCGVCLNDSTGCDDGKLLFCSDGDWKVVSSCPDDASCTDDGNCGECKNGDKKCESGNIYTCINGAWSLSKTCDNNASCKSATECGECADTSQKCDNKSVYRCVNAVWQTTAVKTCSNGCNAAKNDCAPNDVCNNGALMCQSGVKYVCSSNAWDSGTPCSNSASCKNDTECGECTNGKEKCADGKMYTCSNGGWNPGRVCAYGCDTLNQACKDPECTDGSLKCRNGMTAKCTGGFWPEMTKCANEASCSSDQLCGVCKDGDIKCENGQISNCIKGNWSVSNKCAFACDDNKECMKPEVGKTIEFGYYYFEVSKTMPITWRVLTKEDNRYLLLSEYIIDSKQFNIVRKEITWEKSTIRSWLNGYDGSENAAGVSYKDESFITKAFSEEEMAIIFDSEIVTEPNPDYGTDPGGNTKDKVFLLSIQEAKEYFGSNDERRAKVTPYAEKAGAIVMEDSNNWWLRTPGSVQEGMCRVRYNGELNYSSNYVDYKGNGVRPAIWVIE